MSSVLPSRIYPVVDAAHWVGSLGQAGARLIQLRLKDMAMDALRHEIREGIQLARAHHVCLVLNDYWQLAIEEGVDFIHLGQEDLDTADLTAIRASGLKLGVSTHSDAELERALSVAPDYVALGPVWPTKLKKMPWGPQGTEKLSIWKRRIGDIPLVAIGGITLARAPLCIAAGADCVSAVSDFIRMPDPQAQVRAWLAATAPVVSV
ncbi:thiamine phosphate synthase [Komagataeibacter oboediens]|uniref:Thiamine phosphate synthase n=1 Tax=Komagataeibacter oboediens TaxID=65958 RepID=A0ABS5SNZ3_9PROT|nr:thiamine phosphate synthase [Komagataeibacter oboediens]MBL7232837.1 thiamine phosphate synthase [Komagataeibacter oboediens]MBT0675580.1 thiamine phosphate synthase [Komagataeibacter oboediens]MBT0679073.1 thiamine phosphate synthase [Komagataeibacter oboediens]MBV0889014.1 thiamine phosphate synthase [Komagataeibacter oboediens]MBV1823314.1 thiamine phosphate synthase [Komagataeibacter oboediens]